MAIFVVNTTRDVVADDGKLSLREALAAAATAGPSTITFDAASVTGTLFLSSALTVAAGTDVVIDGSLWSYGYSYGNVQLSGTFGNPFVVGYPVLAVEAGASATVRDMSVTNSHHSGAYGVSATPGTDGLPGRDGEPGKALPGGPGNGGTGALQNATDGADSEAGGIVNEGSLTLERVTLQDIHTRGGNGGPGGHAGDGSNGAGGGDTVAGILNSGSIVLRDVC